MRDQGIHAKRAGQHRVLDLVEPADMLRSWHAQVLAAKQRARGRGLLPDPAKVYRELQNHPDLPRSVALDAVPLAGLMEAAPRARHTPAYAAMVIEGGIRQRLHLAGSRMAQASETGELEAARQQAARARNELEACTTRWLALPGHLRRELPADHAAGEAADVRQRALPRRARPRGAEAVAAGTNTLRDLAAAPSQLAGVSTWLRPEHFARPGDGALYAVMRDMDAARMPVDPVTVTWEAARRGMRAEPGALADGMGPLATASAREVYRQGVLASVAHAERDIQADAASPCCSPDRLMQQTGTRLCTIEAHPQPGAVPGRDAEALMPGYAAPARQPFQQPEREAAR